MSCIGTFISSFLSVVVSDLTLFTLAHVVDQFLLYRRGLGMGDGETTVHRTPKELKNLYSS